MSLHYLESAKRQFHTYKAIAEKAMEQVDDKDLNWQSNEDCNSITMIVKHLWGNMLSRWTDLLTTDGEKPWRQRDAEFEHEELTRDAMMQKWEAGWQCLFHALDSVTDFDLDKIVFIRNEGHTVLEAVNRQIAHYSYHVGQIVYISKIRAKKDWVSMSIPRNRSNEFNEKAFGQGKRLL
jgi:Protein of unknown function (DUF1572)